MKFTGVELFERTRSEIWDALTNMQFMSTVIPHLHKVEEATESSLRCRVRPGLSFLAGSIKLHFSLGAAQPQEYLRVDVEGKQMGGSLSLAIDIQLMPTPSVTQLHWEGQVVQREGLLRPLSESLIRGAATRIIEQLWANFRAALKMIPAEPTGN